MWRQTRGKPNQPWMACVAIIVFGGCGAGTISAGQAMAGPPSASAATGMTMDDVLKLVKAGIGEEIIIQQLKKNHRAFDLTTEQLIQLKTASVSDRIVQVMIDPSHGENGMQPISPAPASLPAAVAAPGVLPPSSQPATEGPVPTEVGVYTNKAGQWVEITPEIVNWKTGGVVKSVATVGVVRGDVNGHVTGTASPNVPAMPLEFLIVTSEGVASSEYQLVHLHVAKQNREFRTVTGGVFHAESGTAHDRLQFEAAKVAPHVFRVSLQWNLGPGEYGFLPPGSTGSSGKIYSFRVAR